MKAQRLLLSLALVACVGLMYSCKGDDENDDLTQEQTETAINEASLTFGTTCEEISSNEYFDVAAAFNGLFSYKSNGVRVPQMKKPAIDFSKLPSSIKLEQVNYFSFETYIELFYVYGYVENDEGEILPGTYLINEIGELMDYTATPTNAIVIEFPYNNDFASITTSNISVDSEGYLLSADCEVAIEGSTIYTGTYDGTSSSFEINITLGEYTLAFKYLYDEGATIYSNSTTTVRKNGTTVYGESATITYADEFDFVGKVTIGGIEFRVSLLATDAQFTNPTLDYDEIATVELYTTGGDKLGHFEFEGDVVWFYYNDGVRISPIILMPDIYSQCFTFFYSQIAG